MLVALTVNSGHKVLQGTAVEGESSGALALLVLLNGLQHHLLLKRGKTGVAQMQKAFFASACRPGHAWQRTWVQTCKHMCSASHATYYPRSSRGAVPPALCSLTALARLSALDMCSKSTKGWVKNSAKVIRASGFLSSSRSRRSLQSLETRAPGGSWYTKHDLIKLNSINSTR